MKKIEEEIFELSTGKFIYPNCGFIGLALNNNGISSLSGGYDEVYECFSEGERIVEPDLTIDEAKEVAEYMIEEWTKFRDSLK